jgi:hypothetical protein
MGLGSKDLRACGGLKLYVWYFQKVRGIVHNFCENRKATAGPDAPRLRLTICPAQRSSIYYGRECLARGVGPVEGRKHGPHNACLLGRGAFH